MITAEGVARLHPPVFDVEHCLGIVMHSVQSDDDGRIVVVDAHVSLRILVVVRQRDIMMANRRAILISRGKERDSAYRALIALERRNHRYQ